MTNQMPALLIQRAPRKRAAVMLLQSLYFSILVDVAASVNSSFPGSGTLFLIASHFSQPRCRRVSTSFLFPCHNSFQNLLASFNRRLTHSLFAFTFLKHFLVVPPGSSWNLLFSFLDSSFSLQRFGSFFGFLNF